MQRRSTDITLAQGQSQGNYKALLGGKSIKFLSDPGGFEGHLDLNILFNLFGAVSKIK